MSDVGDSNRSIRAIVVDDDPIARRLASAALRAVGIPNAIEAADGIEALRRLHDPAVHVDLALCDLEMDGMDGVEFIAQLCAERPGVAVIVLSGQERSVIESVEGMAKSLGLRVLGGLQKPVDRVRLAALVARLKMTVDATAGAKDSDALISISEIREAFETKSFVPFYQPRIMVSTGELIACEALVRWKHPRLGVVLPHRFMPLAEESGLLVEITWRMLELTLRDLGAWLEAGLEVSVAVKTPAPFFAELAVTENILALADRYGVPLNRLVLEIVEKSAAALDSSLIGNVARLRMRGVRLAIDEFGTGYASLQHLSRVPFTELSVDRSFVYGAVRNPTVRAILESSLSLGRRLGLHTTAEGIETKEQLAILRELACDSIQGNLISAPLDADAFWFWADGWESTVAYDLLRAPPAAALCVDRHYARISDGDFRTVTTP